MAGNTKRRGFKPLLTPQRNIRSYRLDRTKTRESKSLIDTVWPGPLPIRFFGRIPVNLSLKEHIHVLSTNDCKWNVADCRLRDGTGFRPTRSFPDVSDNNVVQPSLAVPINFSHRATDYHHRTTVIWIRPACIYLFMIGGRNQATEQGREEGREGGRGAITTTTTTTATTNVAAAAAAAAATAASPPSPVVEMYSGRVAGPLLSLKIDSGIAKSNWTHLSTYLSSALQFDHLPRVQRTTATTTTTATRHLNPIKCNQSHSLSHVFFNIYNGQDRIGRCNSSVAFARCASAAACH